MIIRIPLEPMTDWMELLYCLPPIESHNPSDQIKIQIEYKTGDFIDTDVYPFISAYYKELKAKGYNVIASFDSMDNCDAVLYAGRIGFFEMLDIPYTYPLQAHDPEGRFIPLSVVASKGYGVDPAFSQAICDNIGLDEQEGEYVLFSIGELVANVSAHADSGFGGIGYGQTFRGRSIAKLAIVDSGVGIQRAFLNGSREEFKSLSEKEALLQCLELNVSCGDGRGQGLFYLKEIIRKNNGVLRIITGSHYLSIVNGNISVNQIPYFWQGTVVLLEFVLGNKVDMSDVLE